MSLIGHLDLVVISIGIGASQFEIFEIFRYLHSVNDLENTWAITPFVKIQQKHVHYRTPRSRGYFNWDCSLD